MDPPKIFCWGLETKGQLAVPQQPKEKSLLGAEGGSCRLGGRLLGWGG